MSFYFDAAGTDRYTLQDFEPDFGTKMSAAVRSVWEENPFTGVFVDVVRSNLAGGDEKLSIDEAQDYVNQSGVKINFAVRDREMSKAQLDVLIERQRELSVINDIRSRTPWDMGSPLRGLAMFAVGAVDPINFVSSFAPWQRIIPAMRTLEAARLSSSALTRFAGRTGLGAIDGGLSSIALEPFYAGARVKLLGDDYTAADSMANIAFGTALGGGILGVGGIGVDSFRRFFGRTSPSEKYRGLAVKDIEQVVNFETQLSKGELDVQGIRDRLAGFSPEMRRAAGFDDVRMDALSKPANPLHNRIDESNGKIIATGAAGRLEGSVVGNRLNIKFDDIIPVLRETEHGSAMIERVVNYAQDRGLTVSTDKKVSAKVADMIQSLESKGLIVARNPDAKVDSKGNLKSKTGPVFEISEGPMYTRQADDAQAVNERVDPETRNAAFETGTAQMGDGFVPDVEMVLATDPDSGVQLSQSELQARAAKNRQPENLRAADFDASAKIDAENAAAPRWEQLDDANAALAEADALLDQTVQAGDQAFKYSRATKKNAQRTQVDETTKTLEAQGNKVVAAADVDTIVNDERVPKLKLSDLIGMKLFPTIADRTAAGALFTGIDSSQLNISIPMLGGPLFPLRLSNMLANVVWANRGKSIVSTKAGKTKAGATHMMVVLGSENMHQSNTTVNNAFFQTLEAYARDRRITKKNSAALTDLVKTAGDADANVAAAMQRFPGTDDADVLTKYIDDLSFNARSRLLDILGSKKAQDLGAPPLQKILDATREPEFAGGRWGDGVLVVEVDPEANAVVLGEEGTLTHPDYPYGIRGKVVGRLETPVNYELLWQDFFADSVKRTEARGKTADINTIRYDFQRSLPVVEVTDDLVNRIGPLEQTNIDSPRQAKMAADFAAGRWKTSQVAKNKGGISPQEFVDELNLSAGSAAMKAMTIEQVKAGIKSGNLTIYQLGESRAFFALEKEGDRTYLRAMVNNEQGAKGMSAAFIAKAIEEGATHIETYAIKSAKYPKGFLPTLFESMGFKVFAEAATPKSAITGKQLADAVQYWKQSVPEYDLAKDGLPSTVTLEYIGGDRADVTKRYIKNGLTGILGERVAADVAKAEAGLPGAGVKKAGRAAAAQQGRTAGAEGIGAGIDLTSRTRAAVEAVANLRDNELRNLGLTTEDRAFAQQLVRYSRGSTDGSESAFALVRSIADSFGGDTVSMLEAGNIRIVNTTKDLPGGPHPEDVQGVTFPDKTVYIVAENVTVEKVKGVILHEVGVHVGMENMLGKELFNDVLTQVDKAIERGEAWALAAKAAVPEDTNPAIVREEQLAYLVEFSPELPIVQRIIAAIRAWAYRTFKYAQENLVLTEADFRSLAASSLRRVISTEPVTTRMGIGRMVSAFSRSIDQIQSKEFKDWFGDSKIVDENGKPLVVYHGTGESFDVFHEDAMIIGSFFTTNPALANMYANGKAENVMPIYLRVSNPLVVDAKGKVWSRLGDDVTVNGKKLGDVIDLGQYRAGQVTTEILAKFAKLQGHDGVVFKNIMDIGPSAKYITDAAYDPSDVYVAFDQTSIKSAIGNKGTFDPANPDIRYSRGETPDTATPDAELRTADKALERTKSFANVLRAAADKLENEAMAIAAMRQQMPDITADEIDMLLNGLRKEVKGMRNSARAMRESIEAGNVVADLQSDAMRAADTVANNLQKSAVIERRNAALNSVARLKASAFVNQFKDKGLDFEGFAALLVGSERVREGARMSVDAEHKAFRAEFVGGLVADMEKLGMMREFVSGTFDRDIYDALWRMGQDKPDFTGLPDMAVKMAEVINKYQTAARNRRNRFGAWIRDLQGYITRQSHDMYKIRDAGESDWTTFVRDRLDINKMIQYGIISEMDPLGSLRSLYQDFAAGIHMKPKALEEDTIAFRGGANLAKKESQSRALYFKDGLAAYEYNQRFGSGTLAESVVTGLDRSASSAAILKTLGTNPEVTLNKLLDEYAADLTGERASKFKSKRGAILNLLKQVDGSINIPGNVTAAKVGAFLRAWQSMAKLGGALISSVSDLAGYAAELRYQQNKNLLSGVGEGIGALLQGRAKGERGDILVSLGVFHESVASSISARFDSPELVSGKMSAAMNAFFRLNGLTWWTEALRDGAALSHSAYLANNVGKSFDQLDAGLQRLLGLYKIDGAKWELMRMAKTMSADGKQYLTPDGLRTVPRSMYENYITSIGRTVSDVSVQNLMDDLAQTMRTMFIDRAHHAVLEPNARTRAFMLQGNQPGTAAGEFLRYIGQFKSFSIAMTQTVLGREVYGRGYDTVGEYLRKGRGDMLGMATMIGMYAVLGYAAMAIKDLIKGREPRDPLDPKTMIAAMAQGGGLGLYGDFLFGEYNRMGKPFSASVIGPVLGNVDTLADLWTRLRNGDDTAAVAFRTLITNTPFLNLFWIRPLLDYMILFRIQESLNPGYLRRMESRIERENEQSFLLRPSEVVR